MDRPAQDVVSSRAHDVTTAIGLLAVDPVALGGLVLRAPVGPYRDWACGVAQELVRSGGPRVRLPIHATEDRLLGGLALAETLRTGRAVVEQGLLARASGGLVVVPTAERLTPTTTSHLCTVLDQGAFALEREGFSEKVVARIAIVALDESLEGEERAPAALRERLAFDVDARSLTAAPRGAAARPTLGAVIEARARLGSVVVGDDVVHALCEAARAFGIDSARAPLLAVAAARANAALEGRLRVEEADAALAARLVLAPRATQLPAAAEDEDEASADEAPADDAPADDGARDSDRDGDASSDAGDDARSKQELLDDIVLTATKSAIERHLLDQLSRGQVKARPRNDGMHRNGGRAGASRISTSGGRPAGSRAARDLSERIDVVETLRAAAPWQRLRLRERGAAGAERAPGTRARVIVRKEDLRAKRFVQRDGSCVIFSVDASGSLAMQRLAEAKGAVEQVLADCYVRRDHVALIAFRRAAATVVLPPTRSLARVRRSLAELAGGGPTPLSAGIDAARTLAADARRRGFTPIVVLMTDGRANVASDGTEGSGPAYEDALARARAFRAEGIRALFLDTSPRPRAQAEKLATEMGALYRPLPILDAPQISMHVQALAREASPAATARGGGA
ncbi:MAG: magnesium chelatase subunit D [Deltaproteobacteria bacterium]|nr:magnesium chelatase subunit D [Deltaproteobacteria bacterium]